MRRFYKLQDEKNSLTKINTELELNFLKSQINPHFLFNTLNNIYSLALQKNDKAPEMIIKLSDLMRYMLYECNVEKNDLQKEVQFMRDYIELEKLRHGTDVEIDFLVSGDLRNKGIPPLLLIPFVENAFKHGVNAQFGKSWVKINLTANDDTFTFHIENNKPVNGNVVTKRGHGIGIENTKKRLHLIYPGRHRLSIHEEHHIYSVALEVFTV
ncbi:MAG: sensor histidine kinase [Chitinophagales bacterium]|nr:sensor histidine kinase [Chitinophagales bacterium]